MFTGTQEVKEIWKPIPDYELFYEVSNRGNVRRVMPSQGTLPERLLKLTVRKTGYVSVDLYKNTSRKTMTVHRLVLLAFVGSPSVDKTQVNHINSIRSDNRLANLEWATASENRVHAFRHGFASHKGMRSPKAKLTLSDVQEIRELAKLGVKQNVIAKKFSVTRAAIGSIIRHKTWNY